MVSIQNTFRMRFRLNVTNLPFLYRSERPLVGLPHHNDPAGAIVPVDRLPVSVQVCETSGESRFPPAQRHIVRVITAHLHTVHNTILECAGWIWSGANRLRCIAPMFTECKQRGGFPIFVPFWRSSVSNGKEWSRFTLTKAEGNYRDAGCRV